MTCLNREKTRSNNEKVNFAEDDPFCTLFIKGINKSIDENDLASALSSEGKI